jgi:hypothetical protein
MTGWIEQLGVDGIDASFDIVVDADGGFLYVVGFTGGLYDQPHFGGLDAFVAKLMTKDGSASWVKVFGSSGDDVAKAIAFDPAGNLVVLGETEGDLYGSSLGKRDLFALKVSSDGKELWSSHIGSTLRDFVADVATDASGDVLLAASSWRDDMVSLQDELVVMKLAGADGVTRWTFNAGGEGRDFAQGIAADGHGDVLVAGSSGNFGEGDGAADSLVLKLSADAGQLIWAQKFGSPYYDYANAVAVDSEGNVVVAGEMNGDDGSRIGGTADAYAAKLDGQSGAPIWFTEFGTPAGDYVFDLKLDAQDGVYVGGSYTASDVNLQDVFVQHLDATGTPSWKARFGNDEGSQSAMGLWVAADAVYFAGSTWTTGDGKKDDIVVAKLVHPRAP